MSPTPSHSWMSTDLGNRGLVVLGLVVLGCASAGGGDADEDDDDGSAGPGGGGAASLLVPVEVPEALAGLVAESAYTNPLSYTDEPEVRCVEGQWQLAVETSTFMEEVVAFGWDVGGDGALTGAVSMALSEEGPTGDTWTASASAVDFGWGCDDALILVGVVALGDDAELMRPEFSPSKPEDSYPVGAGYVSTGGELTLEAGGNGLDGAEVWALEPVPGLLSGPLTLVDRGQGYLSGTWSLSAISQREDLDGLWLGYAGYIGGELAGVDGT